MYLCLRVLFAMSVAGGWARAEIIVRDLGEGLAYYRSHGLPGDLPPAAAKSGPLVLDLRFSAADEKAGTALDAWLDFRATSSTPVLLLINAHTAPVLRTTVASHRPQTGLIVIGESSAELIPDLLIKTGDSERRAYDALEHGASAASLITENAGKPRIDEASIMRDRANPPSEFPEANPLELRDAPPSPASTTPSASPATEPVVIDYALQRAVQVHRALVALKRIDDK